MYTCDIAFWTHTTNKNVASYRLRALNVLNALKERKIDVKLYSNHDIPKVLLLSKRYDYITLNNAIELKKKYNTKIGLDICDNHFYNETKNINYEKKKEELIEAVNVVDFIIASTEALKDEILKYLVDKTKKIVVIGDTVEKLNYDKNYLSINYWKGYFTFKQFESDIQNINQQFRFIWFGNHGSPNAEGGMNDLQIIFDDLIKLNEKNKISLTILSNNKRKYDELVKNLPFKTYYIDWNQYFFSYILNLHSVSLIPIKSNSFARCKTNNRVATSIIHNLSVCCSYIPSYNEVIKCVDVNDKWVEELEKCINFDYKKNQLIKTKKILESKYSDQVIYNRWQQLFHKMI